MKIIFFAPMSAHDMDTYKPTTFPEESLNLLHLKENEDEDLKLAQYIIDDPDLFNALGEVKITDGTMYLKRAKNSLFMYARFESSSMLDNTQISKLTEFVQGQFSDGGGDGWTQELGPEIGLGIDVEYQEIQYEIS